jgi:hypothetical protein
MPVADFHIQSIELFTGIFQQGAGTGRESWTSGQVMTRILLSL